MGAEAVVKPKAELKTEIDFVRGVEVYTAAEPESMVLTNSGWVRVEYADGVVVHYPPQAVNRIIGRPKP